MAEAGNIYKVKQGDTLASLGHSNGLSWKSIWEDPRNRDLRSRRKHPNILAPGDEVFIPGIYRKEISASTEARHKFRFNGALSMFKMQFVNDQGESFAGEPYLLTIEGRHLRGKLDENGWICVHIPPNARSGRIEIGEDGMIESCNLLFGHLDPIEEISGVQARLQNLGYYGGPVDGQESPILAASIASFRSDEGLSEDGGIDEEFLRRLEERYYS